MASKKEDLRYSMTILFIVVGLIFLVFLLPFNSITTSAVEADSIAVKSQLGEIITGFPMMKFIDEADMCFIVDMGSAIQYSYNIVKRGSSLQITDTGLYCDGAQEEDFILGYLDYDSLKYHAEGMNCYKLKTGNTKEYYAYISKFVKKGGTFSCTTEFRDKYCPALYYCMTDADFENAGLGCCLDLPQESRELAVNAAAAGIRANERESTAEFRIAGVFGFPWMTLIIILAVVILIGGGLFYVVEMKKRSHEGVQGKGASKSEQKSGMIKSGLIKPGESNLSQTKTEQISSGKFSSGQSLSGVSDQGKTSSASLSSASLSSEALSSDIIMSRLSLKGIAQDRVNKAGAYVISCQQQGFAQEHIKKALIDSGWSDENSIQLIAAFFEENKSA